MGVSYNKLWKLLIDKGISKSDLRKKIELAPNTLTKLNKNEEVALTVLERICKELKVDFGDIIEYIEDNN
ncbi:DNA-binding transcriptional regulator, XRE family [Pseudobutyrivibrio sp. JW11]|uniref:helix-turn-helix domain-containing protein n=1 Tax=Pseudobutyrivibrio sp. JW11 TaxID=1855302 RepID=UPI0008EF7633|nr:helix-turn-helix transcriptional regulator [Pseudobutyrivibrio sp. JW11]SFO18066.1 DNA-binding transcriptional regulator, XRE family [Pseudobutyrivibrio sp. JW11]